MTISSLIGMIVGGIIGGVLAFFVCIGAAATVVGIPFLPSDPFPWRLAWRVRRHDRRRWRRLDQNVQDYFREINSPFKPEYQRFPQGAEGQEEELSTTLSEAGSEKRSWLRCFPAAPRQPGASRLLGPSTPLTLPSGSPPPRRPSPYPRRPSPQSHRPNPNPRRPNPVPHRLHPPLPAVFHRGAEPPPRVAHRPWIWAWCRGGRSVYVRRMGTGGPDRSSRMTR